MLVKPKKYVYVNVGYLQDTVVHYANGVTGGMT
jgi:hypothetical protein